MLVNVGGVFAAGPGSGWAVERIDQAPGYVFNMADHADKQRFVFPRWTNYVVPLVVFVILPGGFIYQAVFVGIALNPTTLNAGYQPKQPVAYSHELHAGQMGIDCRYCHTTVENAAFAAIPPTQTCMNCHFAVKKTDRPGSEQDIARIAESFVTGRPLEWKQVHDLPDYAFFNHSVHVNVGVSCVECHGRVDKMDGATQRVSIVKPLSMGWCLECHRKPQAVLRPADQVFNLGWGLKLTEDQVAQLEALNIKGLEVGVGGELTEEHRMLIGHHFGLDKHIRSTQQMTDCSACHR